MILDNEQQRQFLLEMMQQVNFPGAVLDIAYRVKQSLVSAEIRQPQPQRMSPEELAAASN